LHVAGQVMLYAALISTSIVAIIQTTNTMDLGILLLFGKTCGLVLLPSSAAGWTCVSEQNPAFTSVFGSSFILFSFGYLCISAVCVPLSFLSLSDNVLVTIGMFILTAFVYVQWIVASFMNGFDATRLPIITSEDTLSSSLGVVILNYALIYTVPSWVNIRRRDIQIQAIIWTSTLSAMGSYILIGVIRMLFDSF
jgi:hypothetical protein